MASKCRNIWDTLRGDVSTTCSPTHSCYLNLKGAELSSCQTELQSRASRSSTRNCDVKVGKTYQKHHRDAPRTSELSCWSLKTGRSCSAILEKSACLLHEKNRESSTINRTASYPKQTVAMPCLINNNSLKTRVSASRDVTCNSGSSSLVQSSRSSAHRNDTNVTTVASLSIRTGGVSHRPSANLPKACQRRALGFTGDIISHYDPVRLLKFSSANSVQEKLRRSDAYGRSDVSKAKCSQIESRVRTTKSISSHSDFSSVDVDLERGVDKGLDARSFADHLPVPDIVLSSAQKKQCSSRTKHKQEAVRTDHDTNFDEDKHLPTDVNQGCGQTVTAPVLGNSCLLNNFKSPSPDVDIEMENLSDAGEIPLFRSPFDALTVNYDSSIDPRLSEEHCGFTLAKMSHRDDVCSSVCDLVSSVKHSNISLGNISRTSIFDICGNELSNSTSNRVTQTKDSRYTEEKGLERGVNGGTNDNGDDVGVGTNVVMLRDNAYSKLQYFYTSSKNLSSLSFPVSKSDSEAYPDYCDEGFVESPMTIDDPMESTNDLDADNSSQLPAKLSDCNVYESAEMLMKDETRTEFISDEIPTSVAGVLSWLEADTLRDTNALLETHIKNVGPKSDLDGQGEPVRSKFQDYDRSKTVSEYVESNRLGKSENVIEVCENNCLMEVDESSQRTEGGDITSSKESNVSDARYRYGNTIQDLSNYASPKNAGLFESVGADHESLDASQTHLVSANETVVSQRNVETSYDLLDSSQTRRFNDKTKPIDIFPKLLPTPSKPFVARCFGDNWTRERSPDALTFRLPPDRLCPSMNRSRDSVQNLNDSRNSRPRWSSFKTPKVESDFKSNYDLPEISTSYGIDSSSKWSWSGKSSDAVSETGGSSSAEEPADCKTENFGAFGSIGSRKKTSRQPRMLNEIANTVGFVADKKPSQQHSDSLFIDSKLLTREERVLQMVHMQITKMEVKEELTKLKKTRSISETTDQYHKSERREPVPGRHFPITHRHIQRRIKASMSRASKRHQIFSQHRTLQKKRIRQNAWSSRAIRFAELHDASTFKKRVKRSWNETEKSTASAKSRTVLQMAYGGHFQVQNCLHGTGSRGRGRRRSTIDYEVVGSKVSASQADAVLLTSKTFTTGGRPLSTCDLDATSKRMNSYSDEHALVTRRDSAQHFSSTTESSHGHIAPFVPLEVKRLIACHNTGETVLHKAARLGYPDIVLWCCQSRYIDIDATDNAGYTPLHESCIGSEVCIAKYLLHYGASVNVTSGVDGRRPIHEAVDSDSLEMVRLLLSAGADINLTTYSGQTVQDMAKSPEMKDFIKAYFSDLNDMNDEGKEIVWDLAPVWNDVSDECGMDLFCDVPAYEPTSEELYVECSNRLL